MGWVQCKHFFIDDNMNECCGLALWFAVCILMENHVIFSNSFGAARIEAPPQDLPGEGEHKLFSELTHYSHRLLLTLQCSSMIFG